LPGGEPPAAEADADAEGARVERGRAGPEDPAARIGDRRDERCID
jgi:hypothetical protein